MHGKKAPESIFFEAKPGAFLCSPNSALISAFAVPIWAPGRQMRFLFMAIEGSCREPAIVLKTNAPFFHGLTT